jgi:hypothetical protein
MPHSQSRAFYWRNVFEFLALQTFLSTTVVSLARLHVYEINCCTHQAQTGDFHYAHERYLDLATWT